MSWPYWEFQPLRDVEHMGTGYGYLFSGQGLDVSGLITRFSGESAIQQRLDVADRHCRRWGLPAVSQYTTDLDDDEKSNLRSLALFCISVAMAEWLSEQGRRPSCVSGHSFGEFAAMVASGLISFEDAFELVLFRETFLPPAHSEGYLLAISLGSEALPVLLQSQHFEVANRNSPNQTVIAARWEQLLEIETRLREAKVGFLRLNVPHPFHSSGMTATAQQLVRWSEARAFYLQAPRIPFFSGALQQWVTAETPLTGLLPRLLSAQLTNSLDFTLQLRAVAARSESLVEIGPARALEGFARATLGKEARVHHVLEWLNPAATAQLENAAVATNLKEHVLATLAKVTGYRVESIRIEDRLQDDLGIDSLKATEVIVEILEAKRSSGATGSFVDFQHARTVGDLVQALAQREQRAFPATKKRTPHFEWVQREWVERPVPPANETYPYAACRLSELLTHGLPLAPHVLIECDLEIPAASTSEANVRAWSDQFLQCLRLLSPPPGQEWLLLTYSDSISFRPLAAFAKCLRKEKRLGFCKTLWWRDKGVPSEKILQTEWAESFDEEVCYEGGKRKVSTWCPAEKAAASNALPTRIVGIGGARGIQREALLSFAPGSLIAFCGRSPAQAVDVQKTIAELRQAGAVSVFYQSCDATQPGAFREFINASRQFLGQIELCLVGTGQERSSRFESKSADECREEWESKFLPVAWGLLALQEGKIASLTCASSVVAQFGNPGQTIYAAANAAIESWVERAVAAGANARTVVWPPWENTGMTAKPAIRALLDAQGIAQLAPAAGGDLFLQAGRQRGTSYLLDRADVAFYRQGLWRKDALATALGHEPAEEVDTRFIRILCADADPEIRDHLIRGKYVLPAATASALLLALATRALKRPPVLTAFEVVRPLGNEHGNFSLLLFARPGATSYQLELAGAQGRIIALAPYSEEAPLVGGPAFAERWQPHVGNLYGANAPLFHGPSFQVLSAVEHNADRTHWRASVQRALPVPHAETEWGELAQWIDGGFQLAALAAQAYVGRLALPLRYDRLQLGDGWQTQTATELHLGKLHQEKNHLRVDRLSIRTAGQVLIEIENLFLVIPQGA